MKISQIFAKDIHRDINGVIKVGQFDQENIKQELEEYVVTKELQKHFKEFFANYHRGWNAPTDKMGVWISGFFGSGKSHFLKILSYLLENKEVDGKKAIDYFVDDNKIIDQIVLANMKFCTDKAANTDVILFNIDSKSDQGSKSNRNAIVSVFLKVFNEMQGFFGSDPYIADLERHLSEQNRYEEFKIKFAQAYGSEWIDARADIDFIQDTVTDVLVDMRYMSEAAVRNLFEKAAISTYDLSIENFAKMVNEYINARGNNHHVVFLVDEIGQYIGTDSKLMLNLQTITEDLGVACQGKAWVIVTSQQDIDSITKDIGLRSNDFSKIRGRFETQLSLSSANVDEVIKKRILAKNETAQQTLNLTYEDKETIIKNLIVFNDGVEKKLYSNSYEFTDVYPFVPYQFNLLASVLTSIRTHGASGKSLSEGERSMLALFKESADSIKDDSLGELIPFSKFYDALDKFLEHTHASVIIKAHDNKYINPDEEHISFPVEVLKALFLVKYIPNDIKTNIDNIVSLMVDHIDADRIELKEKVERAIKILAQQNLIQKNSDTYEFLTNDEQVINQEIERQPVEMAEITKKISDIIFNEFIKETRYRYGMHNGRYTFAYNRAVDDQYNGNQSNDIGVHILTANAEDRNDTSLRMRSSKEVIVVLPDDRTFIDEIRTFLKIEKYLRDPSNTTLNKNEAIRAQKSVEMRRRLEEAKWFLKEALKEADIYVNSDKVQIASKDASVRINEALGKLVETIYHKLAYITKAFSESDIRRLFITSTQQSIHLEDGESVNFHAEREVLMYIQRNSMSHVKTSMKSIQDTFTKAPYGYVEDDIEWLVAKLFKDGDISLSVNQEQITLKRSVDEIVTFITKKQYVDKLMAEKRERAGDKEKKDAKDIIKNLFDITVTSNEDDTIMDTFQRKSREKMELIREFENASTGRAYPGRDVLKQGRELLRSVNNIQNPMEFFREVSKNKDDYLDLSEDLPDVEKFYTGEQVKIFGNALTMLRTYQDSSNYFVCPVVEECVADMHSIVEKKVPYSDIRLLPDLIKRFTDAYVAVLEEKSIPVYNTIEEANRQVIADLEDKPYKNEFLTKVNQEFAAIMDKAKTSHNVKDLLSYANEADALKLRWLQVIEHKDRSLILIERDRIESIKAGEESGIGGKATHSDPVVRAPKRKQVSIRDINKGGTWQIKNKSEIDAHLEELRQQLMNEFEENTILNISF